MRAYVVGISEIVAAAVELRGSAARNPAAIVTFCRERLASYKVAVRLAFRHGSTAPAIARRGGMRRSGKSPASQRIPSG